MTDQASDSSTQRVREAPAEPDHDRADEPARPAGGLSRRRLLGWTGAGVALAGVGAAAGYAVGTPAAGAGAGRRGARSAASTRPASSPRPRTGCTSSRST